MDQFEIIVVCLIAIALVAFGRRPRSRQYRIALVLIATAFVSFATAARMGEDLVFALPLFVIGIVFFGFAMKPLYRVFRSTIDTVSKRI